MACSLDARRRRFGTFFLLLALGMLIWGQTLLEPHLKGMAFILYWMICLLCTSLSLLIALVDFWIVRNRIRRQQSELTHGAIEKLHTEEHDPPETPAR
jgi:hypothetical protein